MRPSRSALAAAATVAVALGVLLAVGRMTAGELRPTSPPAVTARPPAVPPPPPTTPSPVTARLHLGQVTAVAVQGDVVWAAHGCAISRIDARSGREVAKVPLLPPTRIGCFVVGMAAGADALWVSLSGERLLRVDPASNRVVASLALADPVASPAVTARGVWAVCCWSGIITRHPAGWLVRVDPTGRRETARVRLPGLPTAVGVGPGGVWVTGAGGPIWRVDPGTGRVVATLGVPGGRGGLPGRTGPVGEVGDVLVGPHAVWVSNPADGRVLRVDPARDRLVGAVSIHGGALRGALVGPSLVAAGGQVWATNWTILWALGDPARQAWLDELNGRGEDEPVNDLAAGQGTVWVGASNGLFRVDLARLRRADG